ncbi:hypothetical protein GCM10023113_09560 [Cellulomonas oligotrophica]|uniref:Fido domain-containing protein n=2 Tax=Cellulomonas oligotrophica TaxID=931536 RepID=A0ABQ4D5S5_9CELL|nr:hypothetical protein Col01nite_02300 [Cellulomonas oligotrophica]
MRLFSTLVMNHALGDGNNRLGWVATAVFYELNGYDLRMDEDAAVDLVLAVADGSLDDVAAIATRLANHGAPVA